MGWRAPGSLLSQVCGDHPDGITLNQRLAVVVHIIQTWSRAEGRGKQVEGGASG